MAMVHGNQLLSEAVAVVAAVDPDNYAAGSYNSGWVAAKDFDRFLAVLMVGTVGATDPTVSLKIQQATDGAGTGAKDVTGKATADITTDDKQALINLHTSELDVANGFDYVRIVLTVGGSASDAGAVLLGGAARYGPASDQDAASVAEIVS